MAEGRLCSARTAKGKPCRSKAAPGMSTCRRHDPDVNAGGPRLKLTEEVQERVVAAIRGGNYNDVAAKTAGIGERTFYRWMKTGEAHDAADEDSPYRQFWLAVKSAEAEGEVYAVLMVRKAMPTSWQAAMTFLERKYPSRWGRRERHEHSGRVEHDVAVEDLRGLSEEELHEYRRLRAKATPAG